MSIPLSFISRLTECKQIMKALNSSQAIIHFDTSGNILWANENFLNAMGYSLEDIQGRHHSMFVDPTYAQSTDYTTFWEDLRKGAFQAGQYRRYGRNQREIWIQATYNPICDSSGRVRKIIKFASDITNSIVKTRDSFDRVQALIYFGMDGIIQDANENFLKATGYTLQDIKGKHHRMFCEPDYADSEEYAAFWQALNRGELQTGEFHRYGKNKRDIWLQASYTVKFDNAGKPCQVVKFATDITHAKQNHLETNEAIQRVTVATQELTNAIEEISHSTSIARDASADVRTHATSANNSMQKLLISTEAMTNVLGFIQDISDQINLLALNAAIEAARAGDAGRGFAVVADEVKRLASQAGQSTVKISEEIKSMQVVSGEVAGSLQRIDVSVNAMVETSSAVAAAVEEQSAVTMQISSNMQKLNELANSR